MTSEQLVAMLEALPPWSDRDFSSLEWRRYLDLASVMARTAAPVVEGALKRFMDEAANNRYDGTEDESKAFILMRVLFRLPASVPAEERRSFKGWTNWPEPDRQGHVSIAWPVDWSQGGPKLTASYEGSLGPPYDAIAEYRFFIGRYPVRSLPVAGTP